ncbi:uncharacterized protein LOC129004491 [Macrosteles quadrilineatus]|uniref:uncharacterized protein LOC129004491 n=1 Tax=Macrosteles quadrilineatus TaxID=74068 RepID=UPI0023E0CA83|nr:uncharacterized protein LOC129004491 [Macrosteles quadrilineatus]
MVADWQKAVFAFSFGMLWGATQAIVQYIYKTFFYDPFYQMKGEYAEFQEKQNYQSEPELNKEQEESLDEQYPTSREPSDDEWISAQRFYEEGAACDKLYRKAEVEYLKVMRDTAPGDPIREKYKPKPYPSNQEIKQSFFREHGMFTN